MYGINKFSRRLFLSFMDSRKIDLDPISLANSPGHWIHPQIVSFDLEKEAKSVLGTLEWLHDLSPGYSEILIPELDRMIQTTAKRGALGIFWYFGGCPLCDGEVKKIEVDNVFVFATKRVLENSRGRGLGFPVCRKHSEEFENQNPHVREFEARVVEFFQKLPQDFIAKLGVQTDEK